MSIFYICLLSAFMMIYRHEHIYSIHLLSYLCFHPVLSLAPMLLYFYMIRIAFVSWPGFSAFLCHTRMKAHTHIYYIVFIYAFMSHDGTIFLIYYTNFLIVFVLSRDIFYLCSIYTAKIIKFVQWIYYKRTKEKAWHTLQTFTYTISLYKYYTLK